MLTFDEAAHAYRWNGQPVPHVTGVLKDLTSYSMVPPAQLEIARQRGIAVHRLVELWAKGDLDVASLEDWLLPVLDFWLRFVDEAGLEVIDSEKRVYHRTYGYAGTLDLKCRIRKYPGVGIIDVKRSFFAGDVIGLQLAAYEKADGDKDIKWRGALRLREDQPYRFQPYTDRNDFNVFLACLTRHNWIRSHQ